MKNLTKIIFVMLLLASQKNVVLSQDTTKTYAMDQQGNYFLQTEGCITIKNPSVLNALNPTELHELLKNGKLDRIRRVKGRYEQGILYYIPRVRTDSIFLSDGILSYKSFPEREEPRIKSWWFLFFLGGIIWMIASQIVFNKNKKKAVKGLFALSGLFAFFAGMFPIIGSMSFGTELVAQAGFLTGFTTGVIGMVVSGFFMTNNANKKMRFILITLYYIGTITSVVLAYLQ